MATRVAPIKIDQATDDLVSHAAHFLNASKKDVVSEAVREYIDNHRSEISSGVQNALSQLDGSTQSAVSLLTGFDEAEIDDLGGLSN